MTAMNVTWDNSLSTGIPELFSLPIQKYIHTFTFNESYTILARYELTAVTMFIYLTVVFGLKFIIKKTGKPFDLRPILFWYNLALSIFSLISMTWLIASMYNRYNKFGLWNIYCDYQGIHMTGEHVFIYYIVFFSKFIELIDTTFLCLRDKPTPFIHVYHHAITLFFAWIHCMAGTCITWTMTIINLFVHVILYFYYALQAIGIDVWWKRYLTRLQIVQFQFTFILSGIALVPRVMWEFIDPFTPISYRCQSTWPAVIIGIIILASYLILFMNLYNKRYDQTGADLKRKKMEAEQLKSDSLLHGTALANAENLTRRKQTMFNKQ